MLKQIQKRVTFVRFYTSEKKLDHYAVLGVKSDATAKDIKSAFYSLSKKYHPDKNPDNPEKAAEQFQKVVAAYEALGTEERRRAYDSTIAPRYSGPHIYTRHPASASSTKRHREYTDIDIDYKDFEQFQKSNRRRRVFHQHWQMPDEFHSKFGGKKTSEHGEHTFSNYKDSRAAQREEEERRLQEELEEMKRRQKHPLPSFEQLILQQEESERRKWRKNTSIGFGIVGVLMIMLFAVMHRH